MVAPTEIAETVIAALIIAMGLVALVLGAARWKSGDRSAVFSFLHERYADSQVALQRGDRVVFYSDGLIGAANARDEFFGDVRFGQVLASASTATPQDFMEELLLGLRAWTGPDAELHDGVTVVVVDVLPAVFLTAPGPAGALRTRNASPAWVKGTIAGREPIGSNSRAVRTSVTTAQTKFSTGTEGA